MRGRDRHEHNHEIASALSMLPGSSLTTVGAVGVAFVGLVSVMGVSPGIAAGAAVSGAILGLGDKTAKISDTAVLTVASVAGVTIDDHARSVLRTAIPTIMISALLFLMLGLTGSSSATQVDAAQVQATVTQVFNVSLLAFVPVALIFVLSMLHTLRDMGRESTPPTQRQATTNTRRESCSTTSRTV